VIVYYVLHVIWSKTTFGRSLFAVGGNSNTAFVSGISVERIKIYAFVVSGTLAGLSGFLLSSYMGAVTTTFGKVYQMDSIAAAVIGGISLTGGKGSIIGVLGGVLLLTVIQVGLQVLGISPYYVEMAGGLMILLAVLIDAIRQKYER
jgi:simple sugar transport system permease protein/ribose transport system permease protein